MLGFNTEDEAKKAYLSNYDKDWKGFSHITSVGLEQFRKWLYDGHRQIKPFYQYVEFKNGKIDENQECRHTVVLTESQIREIMTDFNKNRLI